MLHAPGEEEMKAGCNDLELTGSYWGSMPTVAQASIDGNRDIYICSLR